MNETKNEIESISNWANKLEERIHNMEDRNTEIIQLEDKRELRF